MPFVVFLKWEELESTLFKNERSTKEASSCIS